MAQLSQKEQLAFHEYSVRYRAGLANRNRTLQASLRTVQETVGSQYEQEQSITPGPSAEPSTPSPEPEPPEPGI